MKFDIAELDKNLLIKLYKGILRPRMIEEKMLILLRQGKISKWFSGIGQEAISVGVTMALDFDEYVLPMHRNLGVFTSKDIPLNRLFSQFQGKLNGFTKGRDRSFHFGSKDHNIVGMISHLGPQMGVADGIALANKIKKNKKIVAVFTGDGGASEGDFHEAINVAAVWELPVIFVIENNGYGLSTPNNEQFKCEKFSDKGIGYGIEAYTIDGNNIVEVFNKVSEIKQQMLIDSKPVILECMTFRMRGHEEASGTKYVPKEILNKWAKKDPVIRFEDFLISKNILDNSKVNKIKDEFKKSLLTQITALISYPVMRAVKKKMDPRRYNGASLLGLKGIVVKSHGGADSYAFERAINTAYYEVKNNILEQIKTSISKQSNLNAEIF